MNSILLFNETIMKDAKQCLTVFLGTGMLYALSNASVCYICPKIIISVELVRVNIQGLTLGNK